MTAEEHERLVTRVSKLLRGTSDVSLACREMVVAVRLYNAALHAMRREVLRSGGDEDCVALLQQSMKHQAASEQFSHDELLQSLNYTMGWLAEEVRKERAAAFTEAADSARAQRQVRLSRAVQLPFCVFHGDSSGNALYSDRSLVFAGESADVRWCLDRIAEVFANAEDELYSPTLLRLLGPHHEQTEAAQQRQLDVSSIGRDWVANVPFNRWAFGLRSSKTADMFSMFSPWLRRREIDWLMVDDLVAGREDRYSSESPWVIANDVHRGLDKLLSPSGAGFIAGVTLPYSDYSLNEAANSLVVHSNLLLVSRKSQGDGRVAITARRPDMPETEIVLGEVQ